MFKLSGRNILVRFIYVYVCKQLTTKQYTFIFFVMISFDIFTEHLFIS